MAPDEVFYPLKGKTYYLRKGSATTLLFSLARKLAKLEHKGMTVEAVHIWPAYDDWVAHALVQDPNDPPSLAGSRYGG